MWLFLTFWCISAQLVIMIDLVPTTAWTALAIRIQDAPLRYLNLTRPSGYRRFRVPTQRTGSLGITAVTPCWIKVYVSFLVSIAPTVISLFERVRSSCSCLQDHARLLFRCESLSYPLIGEHNLAEQGIYTEYRTPHAFLYD